MIQDLDERTAALRSIAERFQLDLMLLFGSRAKARARADSDYDVAVLDLCHPLDDERESALAAELYRVFETDAVDLVLLRRASPLLRRLVPAKASSSTNGSPDCTGATAGKPRVAGRMNAS